MNYFVPEDPLQGEIVQVQCFSYRPRRGFLDCVNMKGTCWTLVGVKAFVSDGSQDDRDIVLYCHVHQVINGYIAPGEVSS